MSSNRKEARTTLEALKQYEGNKMELELAARQFLLKWSFYRYIYLMDVTLQ